MKIGLIGAALCAVFIGGCAGNQSSESEKKVSVESMITSQSVPNQLTAEEQAAGWKLLFDGQTTKG